MCTTCLRSGWRGILERGKQLIAALPISQGSKKSFTSRLKRLWDFIRLQLHLHIEEQSPIAAHCSRLQVGSLAEPRYNKPCTHKHAKPDTRLPAPEAPQHQPHCSRSGMHDVDIRQRVGGFLDLPGRLTLSATCKQYRGYWTQEAVESVWTRGHPPPVSANSSEKCRGADCSTNPSCHCRHCDKSFCRKHCAKELRCDVVAENLPTSFGDFVCTSCAPKVDSCQHTSEGCATCSELYYFKQVNPNPHPNDKPDPKP